MASGLQLMLAPDGQPQILWQSGALAPTKKPGASSKVGSMGKGGAAGRSTAVGSNSIKAPSHISPSRDFHSSSQQRSKPNASLGEDSKDKDELVTLTADQLRALLRTLSEDEPLAARGGASNERTKANKLDEDETDGVMKLGLDLGREARSRSASPPPAARPARRHRSRTPSPVRDFHAEESDVSGPHEVNGGKDENILNLADTFLAREKRRVAGELKQKKEKQLLVDATRRKGKERAPKVVLGGELDRGSTQTSEKGNKKAAPNAYTGGTKQKKQMDQRPGAGRQKTKEKEREREKNRESSWDRDLEQRPKAPRRKRGDRERTPPKRRDSASFSDLDGDLGAQAREHEDRRAPAEEQSSRLVTELISQLANLGLIGSQSKSEIPGDSKSYQGQAEATPSQVQGLGHPNASPSQEQSETGPIPKQHMRAAELKRKKWEAERAENEKLGVWNPFGKPGGGAPASLPSPTSAPPQSEFAALLANAAPLAPGALSSPNQITPNASFSAMPGQNMPLQIQLPVQAPSTYLQNPQPQAPMMAANQFPNQNLPLNITQNMNPPSPTVNLDPNQPSFLLPAAIRSTFIPGVMAPIDDLYKNTKVQERNRWLQELEQQVKEKNAEKAKQKELAAQLDAKQNSSFISSPPAAAYGS